MKKRALITGITGQDGSYLAEFLLAQDYEVHGMVRRSSVETDQRIRPFKHRLHLHEGDLADPGSIDTILRVVEPDEIYNLGGMSDVATSFKMPEYTMQVNAMGPLHILAALVNTGRKHVRFYQAGTSELYGGVLGTEPQDENTPFRPRSPYATAKLHAVWSVANFRDAYGLFACNGILFNHESERRGEAFVTRKITRGVARLARGGAEPVILGNLDARRDWGYAPEYVVAMYRMLQRGKPDDFVIATGKTHSVREFFECSCAAADIEVAWESDKGFDAKTGRPLVRTDDRFKRPNEVHVLRGYPAKAERDLDWKSETSMQQIAAIMTEYDLRTT